MSEPPDLRELVGEDVDEDELRKLRRVDSLLRSVPPPPAEVPASLTRAVRATTPAPIWTRRRTALAAAAAAALAALAAGAGAWLAGGTAGFEAREMVRMEATENAPGASAVIRLGEAREDGNWTLELETEGLPELPPGGYYLLWLAEDGEYAGPCGTFRTDDGDTTVRMNASYRLAEYDEWVVTAELPDAPEDAEPPWLLHAPIDRA
jgi:Anti-sigma-K factor rskA